MTNISNKTTLYYYMHKFPYKKELVSVGVGFYEFNIVEKFIWMIIDPIRTNRDYEFIYQDWIPEYIKIFDIKNRMIQVLNIQYLSDFTIILNYTTELINKYFSNV